MTEKHQVVSECNRKHGKIWGAISLMVVLLAGLITTVVLAIQQLPETKAGLREEIQRSSSADDAQSEMLEVIQADWREGHKEMKADMREVRDGVNDINEYLRNGKRE